MEQEMVLKTQFPSFAIKCKTKGGFVYKPHLEQLFGIIYKGAGSIVQQQSTCLAYARPGFDSPCCKRRAGGIKNPEAEKVEVLSLLS